MLEMKRRLAELGTTIQVHKQQLQQTSALPEPNPPAPSLPPDFAMTMMAAITGLRAEIAYISQFPHSLLLKRKYVQIIIRNLF
jgi:hypothetical protein